MCLNKIRFKEFSTIYIIRKANLHRTFVSVLEKQVADIDNEIEKNVNEDSLLLKRLKQEFDHLSSKASQGAQIRPRAKWVDEKKILHIFLG